MTNPEIQFKQFKPDYSGMRLQEYVFANIRDISGTEGAYSLDLILPEEDSDMPLPVVFFIHGGAFQPPCDKRQVYISWIAKVLTAYGYAVVSPDYPIFSSEEQIKAMGGIHMGYRPAAEGVHQAYQYIVSHAEELKLDADNIAIMGGSAGASAAFYAAGGYSDVYRAFINLWGTPDPLPEISERFPPILTVQGTEDPVVPANLAVALHEQLAQTGMDNRLILLPGEKHTPLNKMDEFMPEVLKFLDRRMKTAEK